MHTGLQYIRGSSIAIFPLINFFLVDRNLYKYKYTISLQKINYLIKNHKRDDACIRNVREPPDFSSGRESAERYVHMIRCM
jgi:hypothetical protein